MEIKGTKLPEIDIENTCFYYIQSNIRTVSYEV